MSSAFTHEINRVDSSTEYPMSADRCDDIDLELVVDLRDVLLYCDYVSENYGTCRSATGRTDALAEVADLLRKVTG
jgi:hypothetical protein